ncbi:MAG: hypothetical protein ACFFC7_06410 [Candidatus Hermodarchaeota archaeon]
MSHQCYRCVSSEFCVCIIGREELLIQFRLQPRPHGKKVTILMGIDIGRIYLEELARKLKKYCACGGTVKANDILLQGDQRIKARYFLIREGFCEKTIELQGIDCCVFTSSSVKGLDPRNIEHIESYCPFCGFSGLISAYDRAIKKELTICPRCENQIS